jgi:hypothetical protein
MAHNSYYDRCSKYVSHYGYYGGHLAIISINGITAVIATSSYYEPL